MVADALSCVKPPKANCTVAPVFTVTADTKLMDEIRAGYAKDDWCKKLLENMQSTPKARKSDGILYWKDHLVIP